MPMPRPRPVVLLDRLLQFTRHTSATGRATASAIARQERHHRIGRSGIARLRAAARRDAQGGDAKDLMGSPGMNAVRSVIIARSRNRVRLKSANKKILQTGNGRQARTRG
jgi:hypothetical protein